MTDTVEQYDHTLKGFITKKFTIIGTEASLIQGLDMLYRKVGAPLIGTVINKCIYIKLLTKKNH